MKKSIHLKIRRTRGITLVELLVSMAVIIMLLLVLVQTTDMVQKTWKQTSAGVQEFKEAREALEVITRRISQATLNTYWDYDSPTKPTAYLRQSELRFVLGETENTLLDKDSKHKRPVDAIFFQAPTGEVGNANYSGLQNLLNTYGYYVEWNSDEDFRPPFITSQIAPPRWRFRLMELMEPSDELTLYKYTSGLDPRSGKSKNVSYAGKEWFKVPVDYKNPVTGQGKSRVVAENILYMIIIPYSGTQNNMSNNTYYDTAGTLAGGTDQQKAQLPPFLMVSMLAVDDAAFARYQESTGAPDKAPEWMDPPFARTTDNDNVLNPQVDALEAKLTQLGIPYRRFFTQIALRGAKWTN